MIFFIFRTKKQKALKKIFLRAFLLKTQQTYNFTNLLLCYVMRA